MRHKITAFFDRFRSDPPPTVPVIRLEGIIAAGDNPRRINIQNTEKLIQAAFAYKGAKAVALTINSPGGSPVQSALVMQRIRAMAEEKDIPVLVFAEDVAASGGYMLALAGDEIYAHEASIIGSIGVIYAGFGFTEVMKKIGIERRLHTAGENKGMMDPFAPEDKKEVAKLKGLQKDIHEYFKGLVRERRGHRLKGARAKIYSGDVWLGGEALKMGLVDGIGEVRSTLREKFGKKVRIRLLAPKRRGLGSFLRFGSKADGGWSSDLIDTLEERFFWSRFGL